LGIEGRGGKSGAAAVEKGAKLARNLGGPAVAMFVCIRLLEEGSIRRKDLSGTFGGV